VAAYVDNKKQKTKYNRDEVKEGSKAVKSFDVK
jgi:hypothetical protein